MAMDLTQRTGRFAVSLRRLFFPVHLFFFSKPFAKIFLFYFSRPTATDMHITKTFMLSIESSPGFI